MKIHIRLQKKEDNQIWYYKGKGRAALSFSIGKLLKRKNSGAMMLSTWLKKTTLHNVIDGKHEIISDRELAIALAEKVLFKIYGQADIEKQKPYEAYKIENYWSISGTLPHGESGGTFLTIMDAKDGRIIRLTHHR